jgi:hypothetical protein
MARATLRVVEAGETLKGNESDPVAGFDNVDGPKAFYSAVPRVD